MNDNDDIRVEMIPIDSIQVVNPRGRGEVKFRQIVANIGKIGLKKPITVARREGTNGHTQYDLVCGQGRLEAYKAFGQTKVPALLVNVTRENLLLMSLEVVSQPRGAGPCRPGLAVFRRTTRLTDRF
jgi:ParB family chromosome partitioning protein